MPFYRDDYYRGDYYRGDPYLGAIAAGASAVGKLGKGLGRLFGGGRGRRAAQAARDIGIGVTGYEMGRRAVPGQGIPMLDPFRITGKPSRVPGERGKRMPLGKGPPRKMNPLNPRALRRALRRAEGFEKFAARTVNALYRVIDGRKVRTFKKKAT